MSQKLYFFSVLGLCLKTRTVEIIEIHLFCSSYFGQLQMIEGIKIKV